MYVTYLDQAHGTWAQYDRGAAGHYRGGRRARRRRELAAWAAGVQQVPRLLGELGASPSSAALAQRRGAVYGPGRLP